VKAVADTNLYVSALVFGGVPKRLLEAAIDGKVDLYISPQIIEETICILRDKFKRSPEQLEEARTYLAVAHLVEPTEKLDVVKADPKDNVIVECAVACGADTHEGNISC